MEIILIHLDPKQDSRMHLSGSSSLCKMTINNVRPEDAGRLIIISIIVSIALYYISLLIGFGKYQIRNPNINNRDHLVGWPTTSLSPPNNNAIEKNFVCLYVILTSLCIQWTFLTRYKSGTNVFWRTARMWKRLRPDILMLMLELLPRFVDNKHETSSK